MPPVAKPKPQEVKITGDTITQAVDPRVQTISGPYAWDYGAVNGLPSPLDVAGWAWFLPDDVKWLMLRDSQVFAAYMLWKTAVLAEGIKVYVSEFVEEDDSRYARAQEIALLCSWNLANLPGGIHQKFFQLLDCCVFGHKAADQVFQIQNYGKWKGKHCLDELRIIPNNLYRIRSDSFNKLVGLQPIGQIDNEKVYPIDKFTFCVYRPYDDHPWGTNLLWPAYMAWYDKMQAAPERLANMAQFGSPSIWVTAPEGVKDVELLQSDGVTPVLDPATGTPVKIPINKDMRDQLQGFQGNGSIAILPASSTLQLAQAQGNGEVFRHLIDDKNMEIMKAIFFTGHWTEQQRFGSNAQSRVGESIGLYSIMEGRRMLEDSIRHSIFRNLVMLNYGEQDLDLMPSISFGNMQTTLLASMYNAIAALWSTGFFDKQQRRDLCRMFGLPEPDPNDTPANMPPMQPTGNVVKNNQSDNAQEEAVENQGGK